MVRKSEDSGRADIPQEAGARRVLDLVADKWAILVVYALADGTRRYNDLHREIAEVSQKMLTQTLRGLECNGLVQRTVYPSVPPKVEYALTDLGSSLLQAMAPLKEWSEHNFPDVEAARSKFRERTTGTTNYSTS